MSRNSVLQREVPQQPLLIAHGTELHATRHNVMCVDGVLALGAIVCLQSGLYLPTFRAELTVGYSYVGVSGENNGSRLLGYLPVLISL